MRSRRGREQRDDVRQALDPNRFIGIELPPDLLFDRQYQAQMCKTIPALKCADPHVIGNHRRASANNFFAR